MLNKRWVFTLTLIFFSTTVHANSDEPIQLNVSAEKVAEKVILWRRDIHQHPELSFQETRTAALVAKHLRQLGFDEVRTGVGGTGVVGILKGAGRGSGSVVALRADMDALPIEEKTNLPFASKVTTQLDGETVPVMHACGHDAHVAILMGVAEVLASLRNQLSGTIMLIFQPAEEGLANGSGAQAMMADKLFAEVQPNAIFGLHVAPLPSGNIYYRSGPAAASADEFHIHVKGKGSHGAMPWGGTDSITAASQIVVSLQSIVSRRLDLTAAPAVLSVGSLHGGRRSNVIPDSVEMKGTVRAYNVEAQQKMHQLIPSIASHIAETYGSTAETTIKKSYPILINDPQLGERMLPNLQKFVGTGLLHEAPMMLGAEDFGAFTRDVPGFYLMLGIAPEGKPVTVNHAPDFSIDESALIVGVTVLSHLAIDYLLMNK